jgi:hypothetical protein
MRPICDHESVERPCDERRRGDIGSRVAMLSSPALEAKNGAKRPRAERARRDSNSRPSVRSLADGV